MNDKNFAQENYCPTVPETCDRHWTSWGSEGNICDEPFAKDVPFWRLDSQGNPTLWKKIKVLFIGNSFTFYYEIPKQFGAIAQNLGYYVETYSITVPGQYLKTHADCTSNSGAQICALLEKVRDFDCVVLQEQSTNPVTDCESFFNAVKSLKTLIDETQQHAKVYLYQTWGFPSFGGSVCVLESKLYKAYNKTAEQSGCKVSCVGRAFKYLIENTDVDPYFTDGKHPSSAGAYLSACVHVASILGADVRKTTLTGKDIAVKAHENAPARTMDLDEAMCETLRSVAYRTVFGGK